MIKFLSKNWIKYLIFWAWNLVFLITLITVQANEPFLFSLLKEIFTGLIPPSFGIFTLIILLFPLLSIFIGFKILNNNPSRLIRYFYGVEVPILLLCVLRLSAFRELTTSSAIVIYSILAGIIFFFYQLMRPSEQTSHTRITLYTLLALIGTYAGILLAFFAIPMGGFFVQGCYEAIKAIIRDPILILQGSFFGFIAITFVILTSTLFIVSPVAVIINYTGTFINAYFRYRNNHSKPFLVPAAFTILLLGLIIWTSTNQPQTTAFLLANKVKYTETDKQEIISNKATVRRGLLNAYLAPYRYVNTRESMTAIKEMYRAAFSLKEKPVMIQDAFNVFMTPFIYNNIIPGNGDVAKAEELYEKVFDKGIQKAERDAIRDALSATWDADAAEAGVLNINEEKVLITHQDIQVNESAHAAEVTLHERYLNKTFNQLEIFYYFRLPDNAVITGLWLSDDDSIQKKYAYRVSPRGAAQKIYKQEVQRKVDPSLLEQVGPHQYRLRAFPIMPRRKEYRQRNDFEILDGSPFHLWLTYHVLKIQQHNIPVPRLLEKRNVFWSADTDRKPGERVKWEGNSWFPELATTQPSEFSELTVAINNTTAVSLKKEMKSEAADHHPLVLLDGSYSMHAHKDKLEKVIGELEDLRSKGKFNYELYVKNEENKLVKHNLKPDEVQRYLFFGQEHPAGLLKAYLEDQSLRSANFSAVIVLTDEGSYESESARQEMMMIDKPVVIYHINGSESPAYTDHLFETILSSNGAVTTDLKSTVEHLDRISANDSSIAEGGKQWNIVRTGAVTNSDSIIKPIAAQKFIQQLMQEARGKELSQNQHLDEIHRIAVSNSIVTPYSSMIVLVDEEQWVRLKAAEQAEDRFERTTETGKETFSQPWNFGLMEATATPEPHEWILIILAGSVLLWTWMNRKPI